MRPIFVSSTNPNIQRVFSEREFEESLQTLQQLSHKHTATESLETPKTTTMPLSWEDAAEDIEAFLSQDFPIGDIALKHSDYSNF
ncbi:hypothetical protein Lepto7376_4086 [[Leptolyngbya] sp. PCC 7376]|nr:hypothetical protein Lepto7376_4086 [[Leptolyngbya] sp. PCC 7376]